MRVHEASVASRIVEAVGGYEGLRAVYVLVGRQSCVHPDMLRDAFGMAAAGTPAAGSELVALQGPGDDITVLCVEVDDAKDRDQPKRVRRGPPRGRRKPGAAP